MYDASRTERNHAEAEKETTSNVYVGASDSSIHKIDGIDTSDSIQVNSGSGSDSGSGGGSVVVVAMQR